MPHKMETGGDGLESTAAPACVPRPTDCARGRASAAPCPERARRSHAALVNEKRVRMACWDVSAQRASPVVAQVGARVDSSCVPAEGRSHVWLALACLLCGREPVSRRREPEPDAPLPICSHELPARLVYFPEQWVCFWPRQGGSLARQDLPEHARPRGWPLEHSVHPLPLPLPHRAR